ncbi:MAG: hypothetical protein ACYDBJ_16140 [Aggregatilineales bacterium]
MQPNNPTTEKKVTPHPTSPWTEVFQPAAPQTESTATERVDSKRPHASNADSTRATHDALSVIFNNP